MGIFTRHWTLEKIAITLDEKWATERGKALEQLKKHLSEEEECTTTVHTLESKLQEYKKNLTDAVWQVSRLGRPGAIKCIERAIANLHSIQYAIERLLRKEEKKMT